MPESDRETYEAAARLVREAQEKAEQAARGSTQEVPPNGWESGHAQTDPFPDLNGLIALVESLRGQLPPDLARQLTDALRELLIAIRAVLDYSIERLERPPRREREVEDIPIR
jgi:hypothetical protein